MGSRRRALQRQRAPRRRSLARRRGLAQVPLHARAPGRGVRRHRQRSDEPSACSSRSTTLYVEGLLHITELGGEYYRFDEVRQELRGERTGMRYAAGTRVRVQVSRVDLDGRKIDFRMVREGDERTPAGARPQARRSVRPQAELAAVRARDRAAKASLARARQGAGRGRAASSAQEQPRTQPAAVEAASRARCDARSLQRVARATIASIRRDARSGPLRGAVVGRRAVQPGGRLRRASCAGCRCGVRRPQPADPAGQHVAGAGRAQACVAGRVDRRGVSPALAITLPEPLSNTVHCIASASRCAACRRSACTSRLPCVEQPRGLQRMRRQHGGKAARRARPQRSCSAASAAIALSASASSTRRRAWCSSGGSASRTAAPPPQPHTTVASSSAAGTSNCAIVRDISSGARVERRPRSAAASRPQVDAPGTGRQRGARGQHRGADHAGGATDDHRRRRSCLCVVRAAAAPTKRAPRRAQPARRALALAVDPQIVEPHASGVVAAVRGEQPRLSVSSASVWAARTATPCTTPLSLARPEGTSTASTGQLLALSRFDRRGQRAVERAVDAEAEQRIDGQIGLHPLGHRRQHRHAGIAVRVARHGARRLGRARGSPTTTSRVSLPPRTQQRSRNETVATVVAGAAPHFDRLRMRRERHRQAGHRLAGARHQRVRRQLRRGGLLDGTAGRGQMQRPTTRRWQHRMHGHGRNRFL